MQSNKLSAPKYLLHVQIRQSILMQYQKQVLD